jgi:HD-GYP domain-containing protein (c-di-GMP phosphodiesterase class II)
MFISELDRPWLDSPFMLQGFIVEDEAVIKQLQNLCRIVTIDRSLSIGEHYAAPQQIVKKLGHKTKHVVITSNKVPYQKIKPIDPSISFFEILRSLKTGKTPVIPPDKLAQNKAKTNTEANTPFNATEVSEASYSPATDTTQTHTTSPSVDSSSVQIAINKLKSWTTGWNLGNKLGLGKRKIDSEDEFLDPDIARIIYETAPVEQEIAAIYPEFEKTQIATREIFESIAHNKNIDLIHVSQTLDNMVRSIERNPDALMWLAKLKRTDDYAYNHALNVSINLMALGHFMALPKAQTRDLGMAGLLQDIGKMSIPSHILRKKDMLNEEEYALIKQHVASSIELLEKVDDISPTVLQIVAQHHERYDGTGYPNKLKGDQISLLGQMAGIMDSYCAMTTNKIYAEGIFSQEALESIYASRDQAFSNVLVNQLIQFFGIYPVSSLVELNTGEVAVVIQQNHIRRLQPRVMTLLDPDKTKNEHPCTLDLILSPRTPNGDPYRILRGLPPDSYGLNPADFYL